MADKITKKDYFNSMISYFNGNETNMTTADMVAFCEKEIETLDKRAATSKAKAAEKREAGDELRARVEAVLTDNWMSIVEVTEALNDEDVSTNKVTYRLNSLVAAGLAEKDDSHVTGTDGKARVIKVFRLAQIE